MGVVGYQAITGPLATPANDGLRAAQGLGVTVNPADPIDGSDRWTGGWSYRRTRCNGGFRRDPCSYTPLDWDAPGDPGTDAPRPGVRRGVPFLVGTAADCSAVGLSNPAALAAEAERALDLVRYAQVGAELWRGDLAQARLGDDDDWDNNVWLAKSGFTDINSGGALAPERALAVMERELAACSPGLRLIHAPRDVVSLWAMGGGLVWEGGRIRTYNGTIIISEGTYDGSGTNGTPGTLASNWIYGTGPVQIRFGPVRTIPAADDLAAAVNRLTNDVQFRAEQMAMVTWDCCHLGVRVGVS